MGNFFDTPSQQVQAPNLTPTYQASGSQQADVGALGGIGSLGGFNTYASLYPQAAGIGAGMIGNPFAAGALGGAQGAATMGMGGALGAFGQGQNLYGGAGQVMQTAFDPQNALYARTAQQTQDQTRAALEARGVDNTPYGAGVEGQTMANFNTDWQNNQLTRQLQGLGGATGAIGAGAGIQGAAPGQYAAAAGMPYGTFQNIGASNLGTLGQVAGFGAQGAAIPQQQVQDYLSYLGWGTGASGAMNQAQNALYGNQLQQSKQSAAEQGQMWGNIGNMAGTAAEMFMFSDRRVKDDIVKLGELNDGMPIYLFRYKGEPTLRLGLMADDVEERRPDAVFEIDGIKVVDYAKATDLAHLFVGG